MPIPASFLQSPFRVYVICTPCAVASACEELHLTESPHGLIGGEFCDFCEQAFTPTTQTWATSTARITLSKEDLQHIIRLCRERRQQDTKGG